MSNLVDDIPLREQLVHELAKTGKWAGKLRGHKAELAKTVGPDGKKQIRWEVIIKRQHHIGQASSVWRALEEVQEVMGG